MDRHGEMLDSLMRLDDAALEQMLRFANRLATPDGFTQAFNALLDGAGMDTIGIDGIDRFMDEWEATHT